jgi:hypothetical protein
MRKVTAQRGQTVFDIAIQEMGSIEGVINILTMNTGIEMDEAIATGTVLYLPDAPLKPKIAEYYKKKLIVPVSANEAKEASVNQDVNIVIDGTKYSDSILVSGLSGYCDVEITTGSSTFVNTIEFSMYTSWDGVTWAIVAGSTQNLALGTVNTYPISFAEGEYVKLMFRPLSTVNNSIQNIKYSYANNI